VQTDYDPTDIERLKEILDDLGGGDKLLPRAFCTGEKRC